MATTKKTAPKRATKAVDDTIDRMPTIDDLKQGMEDTWEELPVQLQNTPVKVKSRKECIADGIEQIVRLFKQGNVDTNLTSENQVRNALSDWK